MFYFCHVQHSNLFKYNNVIFWLLHNGGGWGLFDLTGAYLGGRAYTTSILKNHTRAYFHVRSYFRGNRVYSGYGNVVNNFRRKSSCAFQITVKLCLWMVKRYGSFRNKWLDYNI